MIVLQEQFQDVLKHLAKCRKLSLDTETTGLQAFKQDRLFSVIVHDSKDAFYFNFQHYDNVDPKCILPRAWIPELNVFTAISQSSLFFLHNAKFDLHMLWRDGVSVVGEIHCTEAQARLEYNDHMSYALEACAARIGFAKDDTVIKYVLENGLWEWEKIPGQKGKRNKRLFFDRVPLSLIQPYGEKDAEITFRLGEHQLKYFGEASQRTPVGLPSLTVVSANERKLVKTCARMEQTGIGINQKYCLEAIDFEQRRSDEAVKRFEELSGLAFKDSAKCLAEAFTKAGEKFPKTAKGNPSFTDDVLSSFTSPLAKIVQEYRDAEKRCNTYFRGFLHYADSNGVLHANMRQAGTKTGRFSYTQPNLQNLSKEEESPFPVRRAFQPRDGFCFVMIDYEQMEFRLMLDYAEELELIQKIMDGHDPHQATADMVGIARRAAKIINFGILYGMGVTKLATALGISVDEARTFRKKYFAALPKVESLLSRVERTAKQRGFVFNWFGRISHFADPKFSYRAFNSIDQGGCADIVKIAMNRIDKFCVDEGLRSRMLLQVHDELVFEVHRDEYRVIPEFKKIMESVYPYKHMPLTCSVKHSYKSLFDTVEGLPDGPKERDHVSSKEGNAGFAHPT